MGRVVQITQPTTQTTLASSVIQQTPERQGRARKEEQVIMQILVLCLALTAHAVPQGINFGESASTTKKPAVGQRLGLLANSLGLDPTASQNQGTSAAFTGLAHGEASPGEFPWTCLLLNQNNDFIGSCAIIPNDFSNDNNRGTRKVITAAHKLKKIGERDLLKVRVGEYDASGFNDPERFQHEEYTVTRLLKHPQFNAGRLDNDIALLYVDRDIDLNNPYVNTACLPSCDNQFDFQFSNGTGV